MLINEQKVLNEWSEFYNNQNKIIPGQYLTADTNLAIVSFVDNYIKKNIIDNLIQSRTRKIIDGNEHNITWRIGYNRALQDIIEAITNKK